MLLTGETVSALIGDIIWCDDILTSDTTDMTTLRDGNPGNQWPPLGTRAQLSGVLRITYLELLSNNK